MWKRGPRPRINTTILSPRKSIRSPARSREHRPGKKDETEGYDLTTKRRNGSQSRGDLSTNPSRLSLIINAEEAPHENPRTQTSPVRTPAVLSPRSSPRSLTPNASTESCRRAGRRAHPASGHQQATGDFAGGGKTENELTESTGSGQEQSGKSFPPTITRQPDDEIVTTGSAATFAVTATGSAPLSYQWQKNGVDIPGAVAASCDAPSSSLSNNGPILP